VAPSTSAFQSSSPAPAASIEALSVVYTNGTETIHLITITGGATTDRMLLADQTLSVLDADRRVALIAICNGTQLATLDLRTDAIRALDVSSPGGLGPAVLSPDGSQAAVAVRHADLSSYEIRIADLGSGTSHLLLQVPADAYNRAGLAPIRWSNRGILVTPGVWDCAPSKLLNVDPLSADLTPITDVQVGRLSPDVAMMASPIHANLGDAPYEGQCGWYNRLTVGPVSGPLSVIAEQKNRDFHVLDVTNVGSVLYVADDGSAATGQPAPDMGVYLETAGTSIQQLGETRLGQWQAGMLVGTGQALVAQQITGGDKGVVEIDLVSLYTSHSGCTPTIQPMESDSGMYPSVVLILLNA
jgi:hypothetical protein